MKRIIYALAVSALMFSAATSSCNKSGNSASSAADSIAADTTVNETDINLAVLNASRSYAIDIDTNSYHLVISADVQWPVKIGNNDITNLQDSIVSFCFPDVTNESIRHAMIAYVKDVTSTGLNNSGARITPVDRAYPDAANNFSINLDARVLEFGKRMLTYQLLEYSYLGGAHPNTVSRTFTYDLKLGKIITIDDLVAADKTDDFTVAVMKQLAEQTDMTPTALRETLLSQSFTLGSDVYCADGYIYIHYNPYEILPYSFGTIDVQISPYEHASLLTPYARELLVD